MEWLLMKVRASYHQDRIFFIDDFERDALYKEGPAYHNIPLVFHNEQPFDYHIISNIIERLTAKYEVLRTGFLREDGVLFQ